MTKPRPKPKRRAGKAENLVIEVRWALRHPDGWLLVRASDHEPDSEWGRLTFNGEAEIIRVRITELPS